MARIMALVRAKRSWGIWDEQSWLGIFSPILDFTSSPMIKFNRIEIVLLEFELSRVTFEESLVV
jgi:hypothetical protein